MTYIVGLTGGVGSGKSTVADFIKECHIPIIDADVIAREQVLPGTPSYQKILERYGTSFLDDQKQLDRKKLGEVIFNHPADRIWLEQLLHPAINQEIKQRLEKIQAPYCLIIIPLLAENYETYQDLLDYVIAIDVPKETQLARVKQRDNLSEDLIHKILKAQTSNDARLAIADAVITNTSDKATLKKEVIALHQEIMNRVTSA